MNEFTFNIYALLTKREIKMAGYWPSSSLRCCDLDELEFNKNAKKEQDQYAAIINKQAWSLTVLLYGQKENFSCGTIAGNPERAG